MVSLVTSVSAFPIWQSGRLRIVLFEACSVHSRYGLHTRLSQFVTRYPRLQHFVSHSCSGCFRLERFAVDLHPLESAACHGARQMQTPRVLSAQTHAVALPERCLRNHEREVPWACGGAISFCCALGSGSFVTAASAGGDTARATDKRCAKRRIHPDSPAYGVTILAASNASGPGPVTKLVCACAGHKGA